MSAATGRRDASAGTGSDCTLLISPKEFAKTDSTRPTLLRVVADDPAGAHRTDSDDIYTGTDAMFVRCECVLGGAR